MNERNLFTKNGTCSGKLLEPVDLVTFNQNRQIFESNRKLIDSLLPEVSKQDQEEHR